MGHKFRLLRSLTARTAAQLEDARATMRRIAKLIESMRGGTLAEAIGEDGLKEIERIAGIISRYEAALVAAGMAGRE